MACSQHFIGDAELLERVNPARREREIDRASADDIAFARVGPSFVKIDIVSAPPQVRREQSAGESTTDEDKFCFGTQSKKARTKSAKDAT